MPGAVGFALEGSSVGNSPDFIGLAVLSVAVARRGPPRPDAGRTGVALGSLRHSPCDLPRCCRTVCLPVARLLPLAGRARSPQGCWWGGGAAAVRARAAGARPP